MTSLPFDAGDFAYGTWRILDEDPAPSPESLAGRLELCLALGIRTLDTAEIYGGYEVEAALGQALARRPQLKEEFTIVTKAGIEVPSKEKARARLPHYNATAKNLLRCAEKSLGRLGVDALDLFLVHRPDWLTHPEDTAAGLRQLLDSGRAKQVGVSNYTPDQFETLDHLLGGVLATNQVEFSPLHMDPIYDGTFDQCLRKKIRPMAWSPLAGGEIFRDNAGAGRRVREFLATLADQYDGASVDALVYAWILATPARPTVVLGTNREERIGQAVRGGEIELDRQDWYATWQAAKGQSVP